MTADPEPFYKSLQRRLSAQTQLIATAGMVAMAGAHFLGSLVVLRNFGKADFGFYSFMFTALQFINGISNAMICAPYSVNAQHPDHTIAEERLYFQVNWIFCCLVAAVVFVLGWMFETWQVSAAFAVWILFSSMRWFLRNYEFSSHRPLAALISDLAYSAVFFVGLIVVMYFSSALWLVATCAATAAIVGLVVDGNFMRKQFAAIGFVRLKDYFPIWRTQSQWALLGVVTTEATANAHSWLVTFWAGPSAFAPIAAAALFFRPLGLIVSSMTQIERPALARLIAQKRKTEISTRLRHFRVLLMTAWCLTIALVVVCAFLLGTRMLKAGYDAPQLYMALFLMAAISLASSWRMPESVVLQAQSKFKSLSIATVYSAIFTITLAVLFIAFFGSVYSLVAILLGQFFLAVYMQGLYKKSQEKNA